MRLKQVTEMVLIKQLDRVQIRVLPCLRIEKLICDAYLFKRHGRVPTPIERLARDDFLNSVPSEFRAIDSAGLGLDELTSIAVDGHDVNAVVIRTRRPIGKRCIEAVLT